MANLAKLCTLNLQITGNKRPKSLDYSRRIVKFRTADASPGSSPLKDVSRGGTSISGDERGETSAVRRLIKPKSNYGRELPLEPQPRSQSPN